MSPSIRKRINALFLVAFLLNVHAALPAYINSTFLSTFTSENLVGVIYTIGAILSILALMVLPKALSKFGNFKVGMAALLVELVAMTSLAITRNPMFIIISFVSILVLIRVMGFSADIFLENLSEDKKTGGIRGFFLSASNSAWVFSPFLAGFILGGDNYLRLYITAVLFLVPVFFILLFKFRRFEDPDYEHIPFWSTLRTMLRRHNLRRIFMANVLLRFFYSWMVIYTPIYLREHIGFEWIEIGWMFSIMLLPFVIFQIPAGRIADKFLGEKELLSLGFIIIALSTAFLTFVVGANFWMWALALFLTRVGASLAEVMSESYFFKKIDSTDSNLIGFFRMTSPMSYVVSPLIATIILSMVEFKYIFLILGVIMLYGLRYSLTLKDTL
jgi:MFS family permease